MSKSRGNVVGPDEYVRRYGADTLRMFSMFMGPWTDGADWDAAGMDGVSRFLHATWRLALSAPVPGEPDPALKRDIHRAIQKVTTDVENYHFNTAVSALMVLRTRLAESAGPTRDEGLRTLILLLAPFAPFVSEELWARRGGEYSVHTQAWPTFDEKIVRADRVVLVVQVDGRMRDRLDVPAGLSERDAEAAALASPKIQERLRGREKVKVIVVPDRLVSIVTRPVA
jgi:leucyl-tRNA synthetase